MLILPYNINKKYSVKFKQGLTTEMKTMCLLNFGHMQNGCN